MECSRSGCLTEKQLTQTMHRNKGNATAISLAALTSVTQFKSYCVKSEMREVLLTSQRGSLTGEHLTISWVQVLQFDLTVSNTCSFTAVLICNGVESTSLAFFFLLLEHLFSSRLLRRGVAEGQWLWGYQPTHSMALGNRAYTTADAMKLSLQPNRNKTLQFQFLVPPAQLWVCSSISVSPDLRRCIKTAIQSRRSMPSSLGIYQ